LKLDIDTSIWSSDEVSKVIRNKIESSWYCNALEFDSRKVQPGSIFFAMPGTKFDGHNFIDDAVKSGAIAFNCSKII